ncbi:hypothetical protein BC937DRAFT_95632 [Endogone sp. FLAS-F59071]|nr:hypothetical protein BC937DRAFT_95632 [Endogone sp. FLAS-F59071]|eukprot:RUS13240.1 hypothetical protein BC937DRAFT_95632 [Endogone sp. FLAS-F59071]
MNRGTPKPKPQSPPPPSSQPAMSSPTANPTPPPTRPTRDFLPSFPEWAPFSHLESLGSVLFSPLATQALYKGDTMGMALQLMQNRQLAGRGGVAKQQGKGGDSGNPALKHDYVPTGDELLASGDIPVSTAPLSLFQGFKATYPSYEKHGSLAKPKGKHHKRRKNGMLTDGKGRDSLDSDGVSDQYLSLSLEALTNRVL